MTGGPEPDNPLALLAQAGRDESSRSRGRPASGAAPGEKDGPRTERNRPANRRPDTDAAPSQPPPTRAASPSTRRGDGGGGGGGGRRRPPKPTPAAAKGGRATLTGVLLVLLAVAIGTVLLVKGYQREDALVATPPTTAGASTTLPFATNPTGTVPGVSASSTTPLKPPSAVVVIVGKAGALEGVATAGAEKLRAAGYKNPSAIDSTKSLQASAVYFQPGYEGEAKEVAKVFKIPDSAVTAMPNPPPDPLGQANILVLLGPEARKDA